MTSKTLRDAYEDLHRHPELSFQEHRTSGVAASWLRDHAYEVIEGLGGTGVAGVLRRGDGPVVWLRADMDGLPVTEETGLPYASGVDGVSHACGHDMHVTWLMGATAELAAAEDWQGTVVAIFQPAEELARGAQAMVEDGLATRVPKPEIVLGQHVAPLPAGAIGLTPGPMWAASDSLRVTIHGRGGHGSRPETTVDPIVIAAATVLRLQTIVAREVSTAETAVVTVGAVQAGAKHNIIPDTATLLLNVRTYDPKVRSRVLASIERIARAEAAAAGAPREPEVVIEESAPTLTNDVPAAERTRRALESVAGPDRVVNPGPLPSSEDVQVLATAAGAPITYWLLGGADPALFAGATSIEELIEVAGRIPSNHSPLYHPVPEPTITAGVAALVAAAREWLGAGPTR
ncbi:amidohydrolase [Paractinoplanes lichenicola]|uniref:Amidohydrolase n=1 Tax=Paractinoplanes lichenicola TaxID=2802976 RepID=A0ABS1VYX0_9ACTN|nr:amidohydrolase [Actinoplanes lichenicola]MBL7259686.1 amidohydrolase [Actinoplanes lichenicola]